MQDRWNQCLEIGRRLATTTGVMALCQTLAESLMQTDIDRCTVVLGFRYEGDLLVEGQSVVVRDLEPVRAQTHLGKTYPTRDYPMIEFVIRERTGVRIDDIKTDWRLAEGERALMNETGTCSTVVCPLLSRNHVIGYIWVEKRVRGGFTDEDLTFYQIIANHAASAIEMAQQMASLEREITLFQALTENAPYGVWMSTPEGVIEYANRASHLMFGYSYPPAGEGREMVGLMIEQCLSASSARQLQTQMPQILAGSSWQGELEGRRKDGSTFDLLTLVFVIVNGEGAPMAIAAIHRDITAQKQMEAEQERLNRENIEAQNRLIRELSAPLIPITQDILVLPLIGVIDSVRAQQIMESMLQGVQAYNAEVVIIDITGVPVLDTSVANYLIQMTSAAALLGAKSVLVGIMPSVAQTLVELGVDLSGIVTRNNLQGGVEYALRMQGLHITALSKG